MYEIILIAHAGATWFMAGLIWFVQLVHYPLMGEVGDAGWRRYERLHQQRTTWIVGPAMLVEAVSAGWLVVHGMGAETPGADLMIALIGGGLLLIIWISTFALQVPAHRRLERGFDAGAHARLMRTNWIRTACWSARALLAALLL
jgi:uncharacterized membrane protein